MQEARFSDASSLGIEDDLPESLVGRRFSVHLTRFGCTRFPDSVRACRSAGSLACLHRKVFEGPALDTLLGSWNQLAICQAAARIPIGASSTLKHRNSTPRSHMIFPLEACAWTIRSPPKYSGITQGSGSSVATPRLCLADGWTLDEVSIAHLWCWRS